MAEFSRLAVPFSVALANRGCDTSQSGNRRNAETYDKEPVDAEWSRQRHDRGGGSKHGRKQPLTS